LTKEPKRKQKTWGSGLPGRETKGSAGQLEASYRKKEKGDKPTGGEIGWGKISKRTTTEGTGMFKAKGENLGPTEVVGPSGKNFTIRKNRGYTKV